MLKPSDVKYGLIGEILGFFKPVGSFLLRAFGQILGVGAGAAVFGGIGGGVTALVYGFLFLPFVIGGAVLAVVVVYGFYLLVMTNH